MDGGGHALHGQLDGPFCGGNGVEQRQLFPGIIVYDPQIQRLGLVEEAGGEQPAAHQLPRLHVLQHLLHRQPKGAQRGVHPPLRLLRRQGENDAVGLPDAIQVRPLCLLLPQPQGMYPVAVVSQQPG